MWEGEVGWGRRQGEARRKGKKGKNGGTEGKCRRDKHASSLRSKEVANGEQDMTALWPGSERGWPVWMCCPPYVRLWASGKENMRGGKLRVQKVGFPLRVWCFCFAGSRHVMFFCLRCRSASPEKWHFIHDVTAIRYCVMRQQKAGFKGVGSYF